MAYSAVITIAIFALAQTAMSETPKSSIPSPATFFSKSNLTEIVWEHAVNSKLKLNQTLHNESINMIEADVIKGKNNVPYMAHGQDDLMDLTLDEFLTAVKNNTKKGIKLDFKTSEAFNLSQKILSDSLKNVTFPVWLNADILAGPVNANKSSFNPEVFIEKSIETVPGCTLSIGWTTRFGNVSTENITTGSYTDDQIKKMKDLVMKSAMNQTVSYPMRAALAVPQVEKVQDLLKAVSNSTLTLWSAKDDNVDPVALSSFIKTVGVDKVYVDVPVKLKKQLNLGNGSLSSFFASTFMIFASLAMSMFLAAK